MLNPFVFMLLVCFCCCLFLGENPKGRLQARDSKAKTPPGSPGGQ